MKVGIVGLPNVGKSTLFNALTQSYAAQSANFPFCTIDPNVGRVNVNDDRLTALQGITNAPTVIPATIEFVDIAGLVKGASKGEGLGNKFLSNIQEVDAIVQVVRHFHNTDVHHVSGSIDPKRDIEIIETELILADLYTVTKKRSEYEKKSKAADKEAKKLFEIYDRIYTHLSAGNLARTLEISPEDMIYRDELYLLTSKPIVYAVNVDDTTITSIDTLSLRKAIGISDDTVPVVPVCAKLEIDMMELSASEKAEFLQEMGITHNPVDILIRTCFDTLGLMYYFTAGEKEVRAWTIVIGSFAPQAAGKIHTDFEKKFIKAEVIFWKDLVDAGGWSRARELGKVRMEGKEYVMQEGDVVVFKIGS